MAIAAEVVVLRLEIAYLSTALQGLGYSGPYEKLSGLREALSYRLKCQLEREAKITRWLP